MTESESIVNVDVKEKKKSKLLKQAQEYRDEIDERGVIYIARVPPFMKPNKARHIFEDFGVVTRLYLSEEGIVVKSTLNRIFLMILFSIASEVRKKRKQVGGNGSKQFAEGFLSFSSIFSEIKF